MMTEQGRRELQTQFEKQTGTKVINSQGEFDIDYVLWLEAKVLSSNAILAVLIPSDEEIDELFTYNGIYGSEYNKYKREGAKIIVGIIKMRQ